MQLCRSIAIHREESGLCRDELGKFILVKNIVETNANVIFSNDVEGVEYVFNKGFRGIIVLTKKDPDPA